MGIFKEVAEDPSYGDTVVLTGGLVIYTVESVHGGADCELPDVGCIRTTIHREEPFTRSAPVGMGFAAWRDLVHYAAAHAQRRDTV